jgi:hypothetical protein
MRNPSDVGYARSLTGYRPPMVLALSTEHTLLAVAAVVVLVAVGTYIRVRSRKLEPFARLPDLALYFAIWISLTLGLWALFATWAGVAAGVVPIAQAAIEELKGERSS